MTEPEKSTPTPDDCEDLPFGLRFCPMAIAGHVQQPHRKYVELSPHVRKSLEDSAAELARLRAIEAAVVKALDDLRAAPELNPRNFDEDDAMRLNDVVCQVFCDLESAILGRDDL